MKTLLFALAFLSPGCASMPSQRIDVSCKSLVSEVRVSYSIGFVEDVE
jgi:hypothetical protein